MRERGSEGRVIKPVTSFAIVIPDMEKKNVKVTYSHLDLNLCMRTKFS